MNFQKRAEKYIDDVMSGKQIVSAITKKTFVRHINDLKMAPEKGIYFDPAPAVKVMKFIALLQHTKGRRFAGKQFILEPWQCAIIYILFGWFKGNGIRRFSESYVEIPKKNGKTAFAAAIADYLLIMDGEPGAEVYCAATKSDQAKICFSQAKDFIANNPDLKSFCHPRIITNNISIPSTASKMEPLGRDSIGLDGINPSGSVLDEYHEWKNDDVRDSIESANVSRLQSLEFIITTSGYHKNFPCFNYRKYIIDILEGRMSQENIFGIIYTIDEKDDWRDPAVWEKANPNYGVSIEIEKMKIACEKAINVGSNAEVTFKTKNLDMWVNAPKVWIKDEKVIACDHGITEDMLLEKECYSGLDLASHVDLNALAHFFPDVNGFPVAKLDFWVPDSKIDERKDRVDYRGWKDQGWIQSTPGDLIDTDWIVDGILKSTLKYDCKVLGYDPYKAHGGIVQGLENGGLGDVLVQIGQGIKVLSEPTKELERIVTGGLIDLMKNPVMRWMFSNVAIYKDPNENIKMDKNKSQDKIDGCVALAMAIAAWMTATANDVKDINKWKIRTLPNL